MTRQTLRDRNQHVLGYIDVEFSGRQCLRDSNKKRGADVQVSDRVTTVNNYAIALSSHEN